MAGRTRSSGVARLAAGLLASGLLLAASLYTTVLAAVWWGQERLLFHPVTLDPARVLAIDRDVHERTVDVPGARLSMLELRLPNPKGVVFYLHGNAGNLESWFVNTALYRRANFDLVMLDYRGFGKSSGRIESEEQLHADVQAAWNQVAPRYAGRRIVYFGRSLGTGLAAALAVQTPPDLTILVSPYTSMAAVAREHYPWVPTSLLRYPLRTDETLAHVRSSVLLIHGDQDDLIPTAHSRALQARTPQSQFVVIEGASHGDLQKFDRYGQAVLDALAKL
jgi:hypothetical protein